MKKRFLFLLAFMFVMSVNAQSGKRFSYTTTLGMGISLSVPASTPVEWQVLGHYRVNKRWYAGIGTGLSFYEKTLIPLFADVKFMLIKSRKFTPYLACSAGYAFVPGKDAGGGVLLNPSVGLQYGMCGNRKIFISLGVESQKLDRVKRYEHSLFKVEFLEKLSHNSVLARVGFVF